jgi:pilus assembly protein TadC
MALEKTILYLPDSIVKEEFQQIIDALNSGQSMSQALDDFAEKVPTKTSQSFIKAINNAQANNTRLEDILRRQSIFVRQELYTATEEKLATLPTKMMLAIVPAALTGILIVSVSPMITVLMAF